MTNYRVKTTFGSFRFRADLTQAAAPIYSLPAAGEEDEGFHTPYQTADARHREWDAARVEAEPEPKPEKIKVNGEGGTMWSVVVIMSDGEEIRCQNYLDCGQIDDELQIDDDYLARQALEFARSSRECHRLDIPDDIEVVL